MSPTKFSLAEKFDLISKVYDPHIVGELNGQHVKLAKIKGEFVWHSHPDQDELFLVVDGTFEMHLRDKVIPMKAGDVIIIPKGIEHKPVAIHEAQILMFEPIGTLNTGDQTNTFTKIDLRSI